MKNKEIYALIEKDIEEYFENLDYSKAPEKYKVSLKMFSENIKNKIKHQFELHNNLMLMFEKVGTFDTMERLVFMLGKTTPEEEKKFMEQAEEEYSFKKEITQNMVLIVLNKLTKISQNNNTVFQEEAQRLLRVFLDGLVNKQFFFNINLSEQMVKDLVEVFDNKQNHTFKTIQKTYRLYDPLWTELNKLLSVGSALVGSKNAEERQLNIIYYSVSKSGDKIVKREDEIDVNHLDYINNRIKEVISKIKDKNPNYSIPLKKALIGHMKYIDQRVLANNAMFDKRFEGLINYIKTINDYGELKLDIISIDNIAKISLSGKTININFAENYNELSIYITDQFVQDLKDSFIIKETQDFKVKKDYGSILEIRFSDDILNKYKEIKKVDDKNVFEELKNIIGDILVENIKSIKEGSFSKNLIKDLDILTIQNQILINKKTFEDHLVSQLRELTLGIKMLNANSKNEKEIMIRKKL